MTTLDQIQSTDPAGYQTLENMAQAKRFNEWMFNTIKPWCKGHVLEVGSGIGNISEMIMQAGFQVTASDLRDEYCQLLKEKFEGNPNFKGVLTVDLVDHDFETKHGHLLAKFDTIIALNVIEHIKEDGLAVSNIRKMLKPGGQFIILVPAFMFLYNGFDKELGHFVRYTKKTVKALLAGQHYAVVHTQYFNAVGMLGWAMNGAVLKKKIIPAGQLKLYDKLMPVIRFVDAVTFNAFGLSVISVGRKPI